MKFILRVISLVRLTFFICLVVGALGILGGILLIFHVAGDLPKLPSPLSRIIETPQSLIYASSGQVLMSMGERKVVPLAMVSKNFINAIVATEDHKFFEHHGINKLRTLKGLYVTLFSAGRVQGASTITQQLAKNLFFSFEQSWQRKFKEMLVALQIESVNTKEQILSAYINQIYFGAGAQGIEKASQIFFGKSALELNLGEASLLAGLPKSPTNYNPFRHYDRALKRRDIVLGRMETVGFISHSEAQDAAATRPQLYSGRGDAGSGSYFIDALVKDLVQTYGEDVVFHGGIRVYSTLDTRLQSFAQKAVKNGLGKMDTLMGLDPKEKDRPQGALIAIDTGSGAIKAMVGGRDYHTSEFNRAVDSRRQAGSGFKPFLYYTAFQKLGLNPGSVMTDQPVSIPIAGTKDWEPQNFEKRFSGNMILKRALTWSVNSIAAQLVAMTGPEAVTALARACGVNSPLENVYSVALGTSLVSPLDMAEGFSVFANLGIKHKPFLFWRVEDAFGRVLFERIVQNQKVLDPALAFQVVDMMKAVVDTGSGRTIRRLGFKRPAAGKTGTTDSFNDAWFTGFTPSLCVSVWTGFDKKRKLKDNRGVGITGGRGATPIWTDFMSNAMKGEPERDFVIPNNIRFEKVDPVTGCAPKVGEAGVSVALKTGQTICGEVEK
ncbi:MAG: PBP1A family penicillin-binding protein [Desulfobacteraceae bacterium]|nr:PBP1A family penicillin-binding protein [Desulfobacteraceae bacterium]